MPLKVTFKATLKFGLTEKTLSMPFDALVPA